MSATGVSRSALNSSRDYGIPTVSPLRDITRWLRRGKQGTFALLRYRKFPGLATTTACAFLSTVNYFILFQRLIYIIKTLQDFLLENFKQSKIYFGLHYKSNKW